jgi:hypothetical protein
MQRIPEDSSSGFSIDLKNAESEVDFLFVDGSGAAFSNWILHLIQIHLATLQIVSRKVTETSLLSAFKGVEGKGHETQ